MIFNKYFVVFKGLLFNTNFLIFIQPRINPITDGYFAILNIKTVFNLIQNLIELFTDFFLLKLSIDYIMFGETADKDAEPLILMLNSCKLEKRKYAEDILKSFLLAVE